MAKYALVVGINDYSVQSQHSAATVGLNWPSLNFCVADADSLYHLLIEALGFPRDNVIILRDAQATRRNILSSITYLFSQADVGDTVFFSFSGHGSLLPATTEPDNTRFYQSIIPYQGDWIYDFRLHEAALNAGFNANEVNFTCFIDSCHSGGMHPTVTSDQAIARSIPFSPGTANVLQHMREVWPFGICMPDGTNELFPNVSNPVIDNHVLVDLDEDPNRTFVASAEATLIAACKYYETAGESSAQGHGYLTKALLDFVNSSNPQVSYNQLIDELVTRVRSYSGDQQNPTLRGQLGRMDHNFLEGWNTSISSI
ncbi:caspase family protein [Lacinutrix chionoecetis]